ncbi:putative transposase [Burkholderia pseudomallei MSHR5492]|nr:putative transposase [Burkholderia pseudomallei MSHR5569]KGS35862.1 putative transposase [Burkholderia pseudomallei MSHR5492]
MKQVRDVLGVARSALTARLAKLADYRLMRAHGLPLQRRSSPPRTVAVANSNPHWRSDGFEFRCDNGEPLRVALALDCCDLEAMNGAAMTGGHSGDWVRDVMLVAVENRFGDVCQAPAEIETLIDNGSGYTAAKTRAFVSDIGPRPLITPLVIARGEELRDDEA